MPDHALELRRARPDELEAIVGLAGLALGWRDGEPHEDLFRWKHLENPAGASPMWVAVQGEEIVGVRALLRWDLRCGGEVLRCVRAVDTATHPDHRGKGIFRSLTTGAIAELEDEGVALVFNTPNDQSRPGYLSMGWEVVGRVPVAVRPSSARAAIRMLRARTPATKWSLPLEAGTAVADVEDGVLDDLVAASSGGVEGGDVLSTARTVAHLRWRYGFAPLHYRAIALDDDPATGIAIVRCRQRGEAIEATVCELLAPDAPARRGLLAAVRRSTGADYVIVAGGGPADGLVPLPRQGPVLTWRPLARRAAPPLRGWRLQLGDVELL